MAVNAFVDVYADRQGDYSEDELQLKVKEAAISLKSHVNVMDIDIDELVRAAVPRPGFRVATDRRKLARYFEVAIDDFDQLPLYRLVPETLFQHAYLENLIGEWFREWGYSVTEGKELEGVEGAEFIADVYAELATLHGNFAVAVTLFCSNPVETHRVQGMLENIEAYTKRDVDFSKRDIYVIVTPFEFKDQAKSALRIQAQEEEYYVVPIEGNDLADLERSIGKDDRREKLQYMVEAVARWKDDETF